jgi:integral membrane protein
MINQLTIKQFRIIALIEGVSYISFAITMPLKYGFDITGPNYIVGRLHGFVFLLYCLWWLVLTLRKSWDLPKGILFFIASLIPFGTFYIDTKYLKNLQ